MSNHYNHRQPPPSGSSSRFYDLLEALKNEYENNTSESSVYKVQKDEFEHKITAQINELSAFQQAVYELERTHNKTKQGYEEEIKRLHRELEQRGIHANGPPQHTQHPPPNIGHGPTNLFSGMVGGPPQLMDPSQNQQQQPQPHPSFPPPSSNPAVLPQYINGGAGQNPNQPPHSNQQMPPGAQGMHLPKRHRTDSDANALPMIQHAPPSSIPPGYPSNVAPPPGAHHLPPNMHQHPGQPPLTSQNKPQVGPNQSMTNPSDMGHPGHHMQGGPHMSQSQVKNPQLSQTQSMHKKNGGTPIMNQSSQQNTRPPQRQSPGPQGQISNQGAGTNQGIPQGPSHSQMQSLQIGANSNFSVLSDLDPESVPPQLKREGGDWFAIFNPKVPRVLNVELVSTLDHNSVVCCVRFSNDGKYLATGCNRSAQIYDVATSQKICVLIDDSVSKTDDLYIRSVCFSPDGKYLATGAEDKLIRIWDIKKKMIVHLFQGHEQDIYSLDFSKNGRIIVSGSGDRTARLWDMDTRKCLFTFTIDEVPSKDAGVTSVALSPDGRLVAAGSLDRLIRIWDTHTGQLLDKLEGHKDSVYSVAFSSDGKTICSGSLDRTLKLWEVGDYGRGTNPNSKPTSTCRTTFVGHKDFVLSVACSPCGNWVVSGSKDRGVQFWDPRNSHTQFMLQGHKNSVISVALSPAGRLFATGSGDCRARLWSYDNMPSMGK